MNESKENIIKASLALFLNNSYASVSMRDILREAKLSRGAFYHYFEGKKTCFEACVKYYLTEVTHPEPADYTGVTLKTFIEDNLARLPRIAPTASAPNKFLFYSEAIRIIPSFVEYLKRRNNEELSVWAKVVENAAKTGEIKTDIPTEEIAALFITQCDGVSVIGSATMDYESGCAEVKKQWNNLYSLIRR